LDIVEEPCVVDYPHSWPGATDMKVEIAGTRAADAYPGSQVPDLIAGVSTYLNTHYGDPDVAKLPQPAGKT
jgi:hypothetical protein